MNAPALTWVWARLAAEVPRWYGETARLVRITGPERRDWSFQFSLEVAAPAGRRRLVAKIPRWEEAPTLEAALSAGAQAATRREQAALQAIATALAAQGDPTLVAVVPVAYLADLNAIVTERLEAAPLRSRLGLLPGAEGRRAAWFGAAGRWLRLYHQQVGGAAPGRFDGAGLASALEVAAGSCQGVARPLQEILVALSHRARRQDGAALVTAATHGDFNLSNVLVTGDGRVAVLDPNLVPGPALEDAAKLLTDLRTRRARALTMGRLGGAGVEEAEAAFLAGYGPADLNLLPFFRAVATARRWVEMEGRLTGPRRHPMLRLGAVPMRRYLASEVERWAAG